MIHKSAEDDDNGDDVDDIDDDLIAAAPRRCQGRPRRHADGLFAKVGAEPSEAQAIVEALAPIFQVDDLKAGEKSASPWFPRRRTPTRWSRSRSRSTPKATTISPASPATARATSSPPPKAPSSRRRNISRATLYTSFYHAALQQHIPVNTIDKLLRVHSYDVDFKQKVKPGDTFDVFFDGGADDEAGELLYTSMTIDGDKRSFYRFRTPDGIVDYYDEQGNSAKKFLMRNPVKGGRYTSGFGERRHPLLGIMRMHTGVDWAAPVGTPILAAADGTVELVGRKGGYGNYVRIRHPNGYSTAYGHMSRYADGVAPGVAVKQGQIIGYVGSTGFSTGPHCHFEILVNNNFVNPMTIDVPRGLQLEGRELAEFQKERNRIDALMQMDPVTSRVATAQ